MTSGDLFNEVAVNAILDEEKKTGLTQWQQDALKNVEDAQKGKPKAKAQKKGK